MPISLAEVTMVLVAPRPNPRIESDDEPKVDAETHDLDLISLYLRDISGPLLTREEEVVLAQRIERGDQAARHELISRNLRLVVSVARRFQHRGLEFSDVIAEGNLGLIRAVEKFDWRKGFKFSTYATYWIKMAIHRALYRHGRTVRVPSLQSDRAGHLAIARDRLIATLQHEPTREELATELKWSEQRVDEVAEIIRNRVLISLVTPMVDDAGEEVVLADTLADPTEKPEEAVSAKLLREEVAAMMSSALTPEEARFVRFRYGFDNGGPHTLGEVVAEFGIGRSEAYRLEAAIMRKLRCSRAARRLHGYLGP